jgi:choline kinase
MPYTDDRPKCFAEIGERRILDWVLEALASRTSPIVFIGGYRIESVRAAYPAFTFRHNDAWANNNILASLFYAEQDMDDGFVSSYSDIMFRPEAVEKVVDHPGDIVLVVDTAWRERYKQRSNHPESDGEKVLAEGDRVVRVSRAIASEEARGEFIGVAKFTAKGAAALREHYHRIEAEVGPEGAFQDAKTFRKAYLIHLIQELIEQGVVVNLVEVDGGYYEIDTTEDYDIVKKEWR